MASHDDLELDGDNPTKGKSSKDVRKNIAIKLKDGTSPKARGRPRKVSRSTRGSAKKKEVPAQEMEKSPPIGEEAMEDMEFSTMKVTGNEPTHKTQKLKWNHKVNLIGIKVVDPIIHTCELCILPILIYGRMIPCKHVFCFDCAKKTDKVCPRCSDPVNRVEQSALGAVFVCNFGGSKHGIGGCRRTYLSQRDLQAHINYRHLKEQAEQQTKPTQAPPTSSQAPPLAPPPQLAVPAPTGTLPMFTGLPMTSPPMTGPPPTQQVQPQQQPHGDPGMFFTQPPPQQQPPPVGQQQGPPPPLQQHMSGLPPPIQQPPQAPPQQQQQQLPPPQQQTQHGVMMPHGLPPTLPPHSQGMLLQNQAPPTSQMNTFQTYPTMPPARGSNLITVPIQDESMNFGRQQPPPQYPTTSTGPAGPPFHRNMPPNNMLNSAGAGNPHFGQQPQHNSNPMMSPPPFSPTGHAANQPKNILGSHPRPQMAGTMPPINVNLSQPPPLTRPPIGSNQHTGPPPPMGNRFPNPPMGNVYGQPPPQVANNNRTWQGPPPPSGPMGAGPRPNLPPPANNNMGPRPGFYQ